QQLGPNQLQTPAAVFNPQIWIETLVEQDATTAGTTATTGTWKSSSTAAEFDERQWEQRTGAGVNGLSGLWAKQRRERDNGSLRHTPATGGG
ncbi:hypothetical protein ACLKA7_005461, partial [Drosophila subpalustris]